MEKENAKDSQLQRRSQASHVLRRLSSEVIGRSERLRVVAVDPKTGKPFDPAEEGMIRAKANESAKGFLAAMGH